VLAGADRSRFTRYREPERVDKQGECRSGAWRAVMVSAMQRRRVMTGLRHAGAALFTVLAVLLVTAERHSAHSEQRVPVAPKPVCQRSTFHVVVDVGHTLDAPGATSARGIFEYAFNLQLGQQVRQALVDAGFDKTLLLITDKAPPGGLVERAMRANAIPADLFIAIHHDSVPDNLLQSWDYEGQPQHFNDQYPGYAIFISNDNPDRAGSLRFGKFLGKELQVRGLHYTPHYTLALMGHRRRELVDAEAGVYRYDALIVLRLTHMPAVLLEAGSIVNRQEELELASPGRRTITSAAIAAAVEDFCAARAHPKSEQLVKRPVVRPASRIRTAPVITAPSPH
jgi:N-acetylmuramoyl-L-alanine amidase